MAVKDKETLFKCTRYHTRRYQGRRIPRMNAGREYLKMAPIHDIHRELRHRKRPRHLMPTQNTHNRHNTINRLNNNNTFHFKGGSRSDMGNIQVYKKYKRQK